MAVFLREPDGAIGAAGLCLLVVSASIMPSTRQSPLVVLQENVSKLHGSKISLCYYPWDTKEFRRTYARRSMMAGNEGAKVPPRPLDLCHVLGVHHRCLRRRYRHCCCHCCAAQVLVWKQKEQQLAKRQGSSGLVRSRGWADEEATRKLWFL